MLLIAKQEIEKERRKKSHAKKLTKAQLHYAEKNYQKALELFSAIDSHEGVYMSVICHLKLGKNIDAINALLKYESIVDRWHHSTEKDHATTRIQEIVEILENKQIDI